MVARGPNDHNILGENVSTSTHVGLCLLILVLSTPSMNPVLATTELLGIHPLIISTLALLFLIHTVLADLRPVVTYLIRIFLHSIMSIFFRSIEVVGAENIPNRGPIIFTGNHCNQFVDGLMVFCNCRHTVGFLIAEKSYKLPLIGGLAKLIGCVPVARPQDGARKGTGTLLAFNESAALMRKVGVVRGKDTMFKQEIDIGAKIRPRGSENAFKVISVESDTELRISKFNDDDLTSEEAGKGGSDTLFDIFPFVDQAGMFEKVLSALGRGMNLGIFPEGGSSDRSWFNPGELLTLKPGVSIIVLEAMRQKKLPVPVVPVGMQYFDGDKFRGSCVIEFGPPILPTTEMIEEYNKEKEKGGSGMGPTMKFLDSIEEGMRGCLVGAPSYDELELIHMVRRLFARDNRMSAAQKQDLNRRFASWYKDFFLAKQEAGEAIPNDLNEMITEIKNYKDNLALLGLKDYQIRHLVGVPFGQVLGTVAHLVILFTMALPPMVLLNLPVGLFARAAADKHMAIALAGSNVKVEARDVRLSKMISVCLIGVPALWALYAVLMAILGFNMKQIALYLFWCPFFSYLAVIASEAGMVNLKDLKPLVLRLMVDHSQMKKLMDHRAKLQKEVRLLVKKYGQEYMASDWKKSTSSDKLKASSSNEKLIAEPAIASSS
jgi:glycerol-3-phosphate O-acyltransferase/dihydroxyacetone phosphate acyltransferase